MILEMVAFEIMWMINPVGHGPIQRGGIAMISSSNRDMESNISDDEVKIYALMPYIGSRNFKYINKSEPFDVSQIAENVARGKANCLFTTMKRSEYDDARPLGANGIEMMSKGRVGAWERSSSLATYDERGNIVIIDGCLRAARLFDRGATEVPVCLVERQDALAAQRFDDASKIAPRRELTYIGDTKKGDPQVRWEYDPYEYNPREERGRRTPDISEMHVEYLLGMAGMEVTKTAAKLDEKALRCLSARTTDPKSDEFLSGLYIMEEDEEVSAAPTIGQGAFMNKKNKLKENLENSDLKEIVEMQIDTIKNNKIEENIFIYVGLSRVLMRMKRNRSLAIKQESHGGTYKEKYEILKDIQKTDLSLRFIRMLARMTGVNYVNEYSIYNNHYEWVEFNRMIFLARKNVSVEEINLQLAYCFDLWQRNYEEDLINMLKEGLEQVITKLEEINIISNLKLRRNNLGIVSAYEFYTFNARNIIRKAYLPVGSYPGLIETAKKIGVI